MGEVIDRPALFAAERESVIERARLDWPMLDQLRLGEQEAAERRLGIGGSDANVILSGERERVIALWRQKRGEQPPPDLSASLPVMLGCWTEPFNRVWFERVSGLAVEQSASVLVCRDNPWRRCTLDGVVSGSGAIWEAKHTSAFAKSDEVLERYMPQLQHNMAVARCERAYLSVLFGNHKFEIIEVAADWMYQIELLDAEARFWHCVERGIEPVAAVPPAPPRPVGVREVCLEGNNAWGSAAADWLEHRAAAKRHAAAVSAIKQLVEDDVARAFGHGIEAKRSKAGAITIRELVQ